jgi:hypothetical protein
MKSLLPLFTLLIFLVSCKEPVAEVEVTTTRPLTTADQNPVIGASDAEQFLPPEVRSQVEGAESGESVKEWDYQLPDGWRREEDRPMREVNLTFGPAESAGEVYLTVVGGNLKANADRWFRQFGQEPKPLSEMQRVPFLGDEAFFIEAEGRYEPGMGQSAKAEQALLGVIADREGRVVTVKMVGPKETVLAERVRFLKFLSSLKRG